MQNTKSVHVRQKSNDNGGRRTAEKRVCCTRTLVHAIVEITAPTKRLVMDSSTLLLPPGGADGGESVGGESVGGESVGATSEAMSNSNP